MTKILDTSDFDAMLTELGYVKEAEAAAIMGVALEVLEGYCRQSIAPPHSTLVDLILYPRAGVIEWIEKGGERWARLHRRDRIDYG